MIAVDHAFLMCIYMICIACSPELVEPVFSWLKAIAKLVGIKVTALY